MIEFRVNGRRVPASRVGDEFARALKNDIKREIIGNLRRVRCPVHHRPVSNIRVSESAGRIEWSGEVCCPRLQQEFDRRFR